MGRDVEIDFGQAGGDKNSSEPPIWQRDYFDRFLRTRESDSAKWDYVFNNPVRAKLTERAEDWP